MTNTPKIPDTQGLANPAELLNVPKTTIDPKDRPDFFIRYVKSIAAGHTITDIANASAQDAFHSLKDYEGKQTYKKLASELGIPLEDLYKEVETAYKDIQDQNYDIAKITQRWAADTPTNRAFGLPILASERTVRKAKLHETEIQKLLTVKEIAQARGLITKEGYYDNTIDNSMWKVGFGKEMYRVARDISEDNGFQLSTDKDGLFFMESINPSERAHSQDQFLTMWNSGIMKNTFMDGNRVSEPLINTLARNSLLLIKPIAIAKFSLDVFDGALEIGKSIGILTGKESDSEVVSSIQNFKHRFNWDRTYQEMEKPFGMRSLISNGLDITTQLRGMTFMAKGIMGGLQGISSRVATSGMSAQKAGKIGNIVSMYAMSASAGAEFSRLSDELGIDKTNGALMHLALIGGFAQINRLSQVITDPLQTKRSIGIMKYLLRKEVINYGGIPDAGTKAAGGMVTNILRKASILTSQMDEQAIAAAAEGAGKTGVAAAKVAAKTATTKAVGSVAKSVTESSMKGAKYGLAQFFEGVMSEGSEEVLENVLEESIKQGYNYLNKDKEENKGRYQDFDSKDFIREASIAFVYGGIAGGFTNTNVGRKFFGMPNNNMFRETVVAYLMDKEGTNSLLSMAENYDWGSKILSPAKDDKGNFLKADPNAANPLEKVTQYEFNKKIFMSSVDFARDMIDYKLNSNLKGKEWKDAISKSDSNLISGEMTSIKEDLQKMILKSYALETEIGDLRVKKESLKEEESEHISKLIETKKKELDEINTDISDTVNGKKTGEYIQKYIYDNDPGIDSKTMSFDEFKQTHLASREIQKRREEIYQKLKEQVDQHDALLETPDLKTLANALSQPSYVSEKVKKHMDKIYEQESKKFEEVQKKMIAAVEDYFTKNQENEDEVEFLSGPEIISKIKSARGYADLLNAAADSAYTLGEVIDPAYIVEIQAAEQEIPSLDELYVEDGNGRIAKDEDGNQIIVKDKDGKEVMGPDGMPQIKRVVKGKNRVLPSSISHIDHLNYLTDLNQNLDISGNPMSEGPVFTITKQEIKDGDIKFINRLRLSMEKHIAYLNNLQNLSSMSAILNLDNKGGLGVSFDFLGKEGAEALSKLFEFGGRDRTSKDSLRTHAQFEGILQMTEYLKKDVETLKRAENDIKKQNHNPVENNKEKTLEEVNKELKDIQGNLLSWLGTIVGPVDTGGNIEAAVGKLTAQLLVIQDSDNFEEKIVFLSELKSKLHHILGSLTEKQITYIYPKAKEWIYKKHSGDELIRENFSLLASIERYDDLQFYKDLEGPIKAKDSAPTYEQIVPIKEATGFMLKNIADKKGKKTYKSLTEQLWDNRQEYLYNQFNSPTVDEEQKGLNGFRRDKYDNIIFVQGNSGSGKTKFVANNVAAIVQNKLKEMNKPSLILTAAHGKDQNDTLQSVMVNSNVESVEYSTHIQFSDLMRMVESSDPALKDVGIIMYDEATNIPGGTDKTIGLRQFNQALKNYNNTVRADSTPIQVMLIGDSTQQGYYDTEQGVDIRDRNVGQIATMENTRYIQTSQRASVVSISRFVDELTAHFGDPMSIAQNFSYESTYGLDMNEDLSGVRIENEAKGREVFEEILTYTIKNGKEIIYITDKTGDKLSAIQDIIAKYPEAKISIKNPIEVQGNEQSFIIVDILNMNFDKSARKEELISRQLKVAVSRSTQYVLLINNSQRNWTSQKNGQDVSDVGLKSSDDFNKMKEMTLGWISLITQNAGNTEAPEVTIDQEIARLEAEIEVLQDFINTNDRSVPEFQLKSDELAVAQEKLDVLYQQRGQKDFQDDSDSSTSAGIPLMITVDMRQQILDLGYSKEDLSKMTAIEAQEIITRLKTKERPATSDDSDLENGKPIDSSEDVDPKAEIEKDRQDELKNSESNIRVKIETYNTLDIDYRPAQVEITTNKDGSRVLRARMINEDGSIDPDVYSTERINNKAQLKLTNEEIIRGYIGDMEDSLKKISESLNPPDARTNKINAKYDAKLEALEQSKSNLTPEEIRNNKIAKINNDRDAKVMNAIAPVKGDDRISNHFVYKKEAASIRWDQKTNSVHIHRTTKTGKLISPAEKVRKFKSAQEAFNFILKNLSEEANAMIQIIDEKYNQELAELTMKEEEEVEVRYPEVNVLVDKYDLKKDSTLSPEEFQEKLNQEIDLVKKEMGRAKTKTAALNAIKKFKRTVLQTTVSPEQFEKDLAETIVYGEVVPEHFRSLTLITSGKFDGKESLDLTNEAITEYFNDMVAKDPDRKEMARGEKSLVLKHYAKEWEKKGNVVTDELVELSEDTLNDLMVNSKPIPPANKKTPQALAWIRHSFSGGMTLQEIINFKNEILYGKSDLYKNVKYTMHIATAKMIEDIPIELRKELQGVVFVKASHEGREIVLATFPHQNAGNPDKTNDNPYLQFLIKNASEDLTSGKGVDVSSEFIKNILDSNVGKATVAKNGELNTLEDIRKAALEFGIYISEDIYIPRKKFDQKTAKLKEGSSFVIYSNNKNTLNEIEKAIRENKKLTPKMLEDSTIFPLNNITLSMEGLLQMLEKLVTDGRPVTENDIAMFLNKGPRLFLAQMLAQHVRRNENDATDINPVENVGTDVEKEMASISTQFIGVQAGTPKSVTHLGELASAWGRRSNSGVYHSEDVIMFSGSGADAGVTSNDIQATFGSKVFNDLINSAVKAKSSFVVGYANASDNAIRNRLIKFGYTEITKGSYSILVHPDHKNAMPDITGDKASESSLQIIIDMLTKASDKNLTKEYVQLFLKRIDILPDFMHNKIMKLFSEPINTRKRGIFTSVKQKNYGNESASDIANRQVFTVDKDGIIDVESLLVSDSIIRHGTITFPEVFWKNVESKIVMEQRIEKESKKAKVKSGTPETKAPIYNEAVLRVAERFRGKMLSKSPGKALIISALIDSTLKYNADQTNDNMMVMLSLLSANPDLEAIHISMTEDLGTIEC